MVARCVMWMCKLHPDVSPTHYLPEGPCWFTLTLCSLSCWSQQMILQSLPCEEHLPGALRMMSTVTKPAFQRQIWISLEEKCSLTSRTRLPVIGTKQGSLPKRKELLKESFLGNDLLQRTWSVLQLLGKLLSFLRCIQKPHWYLGHQSHVLIIHLLSFGIHPHRWPDSLGGPLYTLYPFPEAHRWALDTWCRELLIGPLCPRAFGKYHTPHGFHPLAGTPRWTGHIDAHCAQKPSSGWTLSIGQGQMSLQRAAQQPGSPRWWYLG